MTDRVGQQLGNYRVLRLLGRGGFSEVYLGEHVYLKKHAALKVLHTRLGEQDADQFLREAQTLARLEHPHIVRVLDFAVQDGTPFLAMEYAAGSTLRKLHPAGTRVPLERIVAYVSQVASALQYAHTQRLMHRDVKPENMLLDARGQVLLSDFGLAMLIPSSLSMGTQPMDQSMAGTTPYLAPEQLQGQPRLASDQYALGVVVYEWLCGRRPFSGSLIEIAMQHLSTAPPSLCEQVPNLLPLIEEVVMRALAKEPELRFASVQDFATALQHVAHQAGYPFVTPVGPSASAADAPHPALTASVAPAALVQEQASAQAVITPDAVAEPAGERGQQDAPGDTLPTGSLWRVPAILTSLVGREQDLAAVCALLSRPEMRLLTLLGVGGIGKTRLAIQVAVQVRDRFADGVCLVTLAPISDPNLLLSSIAHELGVQREGMQSLLEVVKAWLRDKHLLLLLDNFEQIVSTAPLLEDLLAACHKLTILVTSREVLRLSAEQLFPVPPLALPDLAQLPEHEDLAQYASVSLFVQRAQAVKPDFKLTQANGRAIAEICVRLEGLPLALELAAARIRLLPPQALLARLSQRFQVLTGGPRTAPQRQQTLRNTLKWSYDLLNAQEQQLFRQLSVFVGGCALEAVEAVCTALDDASGQVLDGVASLVDKSLLQQTEQEGEEPRFVMLETIREYGLECLRESGEAERVQRAYADYYLALGEEVEPHLKGPQQVTWLARLEQERENLRMALDYLIEHKETDLALRLSGTLEQFWDVRGYWSEGRQWLERVLAGSEGARASLRGKVLSAAANLALKQGDTDRAEVLAEESLTLYRQCRDGAGVARSLSLLGSVTWLRGNYTLARVQTEEALALWREIGDKENIAQALGALAIFATEQGQYTQGLTLFEENLALYRELGNKRGIANSLIKSAWVLFYSQGDLTRVRSLLEEGLTLFRELGDKANIADSFNVLGWVTLEQGDPATARSFTEEALKYYEEMEYRPRIAEARAFLGLEIAAQGDYAAARVLCEESLALCIELGMGDTELAASGLEILASVVAAQGEPAWAARLWGAAGALRETYGAPLPPVFRPAYERSVAAVRAQLGEEAFASAWAEGRTMTPEQATIHFQ